MVKGTDSPSGTLGGTRTLIWYTPTSLGVRPEYIMGRAVFPMNTCGAANEFANGEVGLGDPVSTAGVVTPRPVR